MTAFGEAPAPGTEVLTLQEVLAFRDEILIPSIDFLARKEFVAHAPPRSSFIHEETIVQGGIIRKAQAKAFITLEYADEPGAEEMQRVCSISVSTEKVRPDLTESLTEAAKTHYREDEIEGEDQGLLCAWEVTTYYFDTPEATDDAPESRTHFELQDEEEQVLWSDEDIEPSDVDSSDGDLTTEQEAIFGALAAEIPNGLSKVDLPSIQFALSELGVPSSILLPDAS
jgi:hypothetical protein